MRLNLTRISNTPRLLEIVTLENKLLFWAQLKPLKKKAAKSLGKNCVSPNNLNTVFHAILIHA